MRLAKQPSELIRILGGKHQRAIAEQRDWKEMLKMFYEDLWFRNRLEQTALQLTRPSRFPFGSSEDVQQEALLQIARSIMRDPSLGFRFGNGNYGGYLRRVIYCACNNGRRKFHKRDGRQVRLDPSLLLIDERKKIDQRLDVADLIAKISEPNRSVLSLFHEGYSHAEIARIKKRSNRTVSRWLGNAIDEIKRLLEEPDTNVVLVRSQKSNYAIKKGGQTDKKPSS